MIVNGERALAYIVTVDSISAINGADNIELAHVGGWNIVVKKQEFQPGDKAVFFEIDSKLPETDERFKFLESKHYKIKTMKLGKFGVISQGLLMPLADFPELNNPDIGTDVTRNLGVVYSVKDDNYRKSRSAGPNYKGMGARHPKLFKTKPIRWIMKREWGRKLLFIFFGRRRDKPLAFPDFVSKTDEERVENQPWRIGDGKTYIATEKLDGTSCTYALRRRHKRFSKGDVYEFFVCSRNVRQANENQKTYHDHNIYWDLAFKYDIEAHLRRFLEMNPSVEWVCLQGEGVGSVQGNPLKLEEDDLYIFNFIDSETGRVSSEKGRIAIESWGMKWVPILGETTMPGTMEELKLLADGKSAVNPNMNREGIVYRSLDGRDSFKNVSRKYLLKQKD